MQQEKALDAHEGICPLEIKKRACLAANLYSRYSYSASHTYTVQIARSCFYKQPNWAHKTHKSNGGIDPH